MTDIIYSSKLGAVAILSDGQAVCAMNDKPLRIAEKTPKYISPEDRRELRFLSMEPAAFEEEYKRLMSTPSYDKPGGAVLGRFKDGKVFAVSNVIERDPPFKAEVVTETRPNTTPSNIEVLAAAQSKTKKPLPKRAKP